MFQLQGLFLRSHLSIWVTSLSMKSTFLFLLAIVHSFSIGGVQPFSRVWGSWRFEHRFPPRSHSKMVWKEIEPSCFHSVKVEGRQVAKDHKYLASVLKIWGDESEARKFRIETMPFQYSASGESDSMLHGHLFRRKMGSNESSPGLLPVILLFHTAAGPQDIFLYYKADALLQDFDCIVFICDIMSDSDGWGWDPDRSRYSEIRESIMAVNCRLLRVRVLAAVECVQSAIPNTNPNQIAAIGWCLGGQPILELANLNREHNGFSIKSMITFHGVFAREHKLAFSPTNHKENGTMLICNGSKDPFVSPEDIEGATAFFKANGYEVELLQIEGAKHGFSNPAQEFNDHPAFAFSDHGSKQAWARAVEVVGATCINPRV